MLIDASHAEETRVVVLDGNKVSEFDFESLTKRQLAGNIYLAKVTRVEPSLQAAFVDYGGNRHGFLAFSEIHSDYYQIPTEDRAALQAEEEAYEQAMSEREQRDEESAEDASQKTPPQAAGIDDTAISGDAVIDINADVGEAQTGLVDVPETTVGGDTDASLAVMTPEQGESTESNSDVDDTSTSQKETAVETIDTDDESTLVVDDMATEYDEDLIRPRKPRLKRYKIQEVIKLRQILLVQVVKDERGNKGAALTTYLSLAGRYCVLMPNTARGGGISRKITNVEDRKKIKKITTDFEVPKGMGLIVRTAGAKRNKSELKRDFEYLTRQWQVIRDTTLESIAPSKIHTEGDLIKRSIRDLYNNDIDEVLVEGETGYQAAHAYMKLLTPSHVKRVKQYSDRVSLFSCYNVENYLDTMFNPTVALKSGGYIVIGITEALVAIDVNSGKATKENSIEKTALKTNLEAAEEVAHQMRLRDLAGLIVIDFIDMEERRNNQAVERRLKDALKIDRARIQVGGISSFGLLEMSRQRLRPGMIESTTAPCVHCHGTGVVRSDNSLALSIIREIEEEAMRKRVREITVRAPVAVVNYLMNYKRENIAQIEAQYGISIIISADAMLIGTDYNLEKHKSSSRAMPDPIDIPDVSDLPVSDDFAEENITDDAQEQDKPKRKRRRRRGGRGRNKSEENAAEETSAEEGDTETTVADDDAQDSVEKKPRRKRRTAKVKEDTPASDTDTVEEKTDTPSQNAELLQAPAQAEEETTAPQKKRRGWWSLSGS